jgi:hypothetical protein
MHEHGLVALELASHDPSTLDAFDNVSGTFDSVTKLVHLEQLQFEQKVTVVNFVVFCGDYVDTKVIMWSIETCIQHRMTPLHITTKRGSDQLALSLLKLKNCSPNKMDEVSDFTDEVTD